MLIVNVQLFFAEAEVLYNYMTKLNQDLILLNNKKMMGCFKI